MKPRLLTVCLSVLLWCLAAVQPASAASEPETVINIPRNASWAERLAAHEVRRYVYLRTGRLLPISAEPLASQKGQVILLATKHDAVFDGVATAEFAATLKSLAPQSYWLKTLELRAPESKVAQHHQVLVLAGGDDAGVLYAAYRLTELLGVRFYLHGDVLPDEPMEWKLPVLDVREAPLFALRGIQPFHDFPEGPDWWNCDDYFAILGQLPKLRMNFFGLHTYPEGHPNAEPTVWLGLPGDIGAGGKVKFSYPASYMSTVRGNWGYAPKRTSDYVFGSAALFERDDFGPEVMFGAMPEPDRPELCNEVFAGTAAMLRDAFSFAHRLGIKTCVGTETPLIIPKRLQERLKELGKDPKDPTVMQALYEGIFRRAAQVYPLDYYWFWTPEGWTWSGVKEEQIKATLDDLNAALAAHKKVQPPFKLATCGWVLGPEQDRAMFDKVLPKEVAVSCINRQVGYTPVDPGFAEVEGRSKWAIPWLEDDGALSSPELWVGRMRRDAADSLRYGCNGLMGIHWRTRVLSPNILALAQAAWDQSSWRDSYHPAAAPASAARVPCPVGGQVAAFPNNPIADTTDVPLYQTVRYNLLAYRLPASNGLCKVTLKFCEPFYGAAGKRVFDVKLQGRTVLTNLDVFARVGQNRALDFTFNEVRVTNGWLEIRFVPRVEFPCIAALAVEGEGCRTKINCGGPAYHDYAADAAPEPAGEPFPSTVDFYEDWAAHEFGPDASAVAARVFESVDGALPKPSTWVAGPGGIRPDPRPWEKVREEYAFVDTFAGLRPRVTGVGNRERFEYWLNTFLYFRGIGEVNCAWAEFNRAMEQVRQEKDPAKQKALAGELALPARVELVRLVGVVYERMLATVSTTGELGTVANWNQHILPDLLTKPGEELARILGTPLPEAAQPGQAYHGPVRVVVPTKRTSLAAGEPLELKVMVLSEAPVSEATLFWRKLGEKRFSSSPLRHQVRGVYAGALPATGLTDFEYYIQARTVQGQAACWPATAPRMNQTVVVVP